MSDKETVDNLLHKSDMISMMDDIKENVDKCRFMIVITLDDEGSYDIQFSGCVSEIELRGLADKINETLQDEAHSIEGGQ